MNKYSSVIILAGGKGKRFGMMKQFIPIHKIPLFVYTLKKFEDYNIILTVPKKFINLATKIITTNNLSKITVIEGGKNRQESSKKGLDYIKNNFKCKKVIITDANRPFVTKKTIEKGLNLLDKYKAVVTVCKTANTQCTSYDGKFLYNVLLRHNMYELLMPQFFNFKIIHELHQLAIENKIKESTDDSQLISLFTTYRISMLSIDCWEGLKLTTMGDYPIFKFLLKGKK